MSKRSITITASMLRSYKRCPRRFELEYVQNLKPIRMKRCASTTWTTRRMIAARNTEPISTWSNPPTNWRARS